MTKYPPVNEVFELTLDGSLPENTPQGVLKTLKGGSGGWHYKKPVVTSRQTRKFKLVQIGYQTSMWKIQEMLKGYGPINGLWMKAFNDTYPQPDGNGPIGVDDNSWSPPTGCATWPYVFNCGTYFLYVDEHGKLDFCSGEFGYLTSDWRWLVPAEG